MCPVASHIDTSTPGQFQFLLCQQMGQHNFQSLSKEWAYIDQISNAPHLTLFGLPLNCSAAICLLCLITANTSTDPLLLYHLNPQGMHACKHNAQITDCSLDLHFSHPMLLSIPAEICTPRFCTHTPRGMHAHTMSYFLLTADSIRLQ